MFLEGCFREIGKTDLPGILGSIPWFDIRRHSLLTPMLAGRAGTGLPSAWCRLTRSPSLPFPLYLLPDQVSIDHSFCAPVMCYGHGSLLAHIFVLLCFPLEVVVVVFRVLGFPQISVYFSLSARI